MATIFSLNDASLCLAIPGSGIQVSERNAAAIDTLDGGAARDFGAKQAGSRFQFQTDIEDGDLASLTAAVEAGTLIGLSSGAQSRAVIVARIHAVWLANRRNAATLDCVVMKLL